MKKLKPHGKSTSKIEIHTSVNGLWLLVNDKEYFLSCKEYPWFQKATLSELYQVELLHESHLHWSKLDVDLELTAIENPEMYPLIFKK